MAVKVTFNSNEAEFLATLLERAADKFSSHGCNDFPVPNTDENWALVERMGARNISRTVEQWRLSDDAMERPKGDTICLNDSVLMDYLRTLVQDAIHEMIASGHDRPVCIVCQTAIIGKACHQGGSLAHPIHRRCEVRIGRSRDGGI